MLTFKSKITETIRTFDDKIIIKLESNLSNLPMEEINNICQNDVKVVVSKWRENRSLNANNYAWLLMDKIAEKTKTTKEEIYKEIIKRVGVFEILPIKNIAVESFIKKWQSNGVGWVCEILGKSKIKNYTNVMAYFGSSTYNSKEMARLIDEIVSEAKNLGIQTETPEMIANLKSAWSEYEKQER